MLRPRIIPCLLVRNKGLVKTLQFKDGKYVGDPINAVRIFKEKGADELMVIDIDATSSNNEPDYKMIENLASECRMPLCYGGGIKTLEQSQRIFSLGVEKIALSSAAIQNPSQSWHNTLFTTFCKHLHSNTNSQNWNIMIHNYVINHF